jgi:hypothetical protein
MADLSGLEWAVALGAGLSLLVAWEIGKALVRMTERSTTARPGRSWPALPARGGLSMPARGEPAGGGTAAPP